MIAPEKRRRDKTLARAENVPRSSLALSLCYDPMFYPDATGARVWPAGDVAGRKNSRDICLQKFVNQNAVIDRDARLFGKRSIRANADSNDNQLAIQNCSVIELHIPTSDGHRCSPKMKFHAVCFVSFANQISQFTPENSFEWQRLFSDHSDLDFALSQRRRHFQADEACADHHGAFCIFRFLDDAPAVRQSSQITNIRKILSWNLEPNRLGASRKQ